MSESFKPCLVLQWASGLKRGFAYSIIKSLSSFYIALPTAEGWGHGCFSCGPKFPSPPVLQHKQSIRATVSTVLPTQGLIWLGKHSPPHPVVTDRCSGIVVFLWPYVNHITGTWWSYTHCSNQPSRPPLPSTIHHVNDSCNQLAVVKVLGTRVAWKSRYVPSVFRSSLHTKPNNFSFQLATWTEYTSAWRF